MTSYLITYLHRYVDDLASFLCSHYRTVNGLNDIRGFRQAIDSTLKSSPPIRSSLVHPIAIRRAVPKIETVPSLPSNFQIMFDDATIQKITTVLFSATATFMLAFTARLISSRLHPPLHLLTSRDKENENDNVAQRLSGADKFMTMLPSSEETVDHQGQCQCQRVQFRIRAHRELHVVDHSTSKLRFPRVLVSSDSFEWLMDASALKMFSLTHQDGVHEESSSGSHIFCSDCGTQLVFVPVASVDSKVFNEGSSIVVPLQVNLDCIDKKKVQCIHHHHHPQALASIPIYQTLSPSRLSKANAEDSSSSQRSFFHHYKQLVDHTQADQSESRQPLPRTEESRQGESATPTKSPIPLSTDTTVMSTPSHRLNATSAIVSGDNNVDDEPEFDEYEDFEDDDDDEDADFDMDDVNRSPHSPRFALNMQLNSLGHYSDQRRNKRPASTRSQHGQQHHGRHSNVFFPNHAASRPSSTHPHYPHGHSQSTPVHGKGRREGAIEGSAPDSDTTEELFFEQFYAPPSPFSPLAAGATPRTTVVNSSLVNGHNNGSSNYLQYILGADDSQLTTTTELPAVQPMPGQESMITPPRVKPNKTYRPIHQQHHHHSLHSHHHPSPRGTTRRRSRSGTPTSHRNRPSPGLDGSHSQSQSGTSSPASSLSASASGSGGSMHSSRRLRNFQSTMEVAGQDDFHHNSGSRRNSSGKGRSLLFSTATLRDEYGDEIIDDEALAGLLMEDTTAVFGDLGGDADDDGLAGIEGGDEGSVSSLESLPRELPVQRPLPSLSNSTSLPGVFPAEVRQNVIDEDTMDDITNSASAIEQLYDSPSSLWQRRHVTMRRSTPGRLHTTATKAGHKPSVRSNEGMEASTYTRDAVSYGGKTSSNALFSSPFDETSPADMPSYQNLKRYLDRHLSPSSSSNTSTVGGKSVPTASSSSVHQTHL